MWNDQFWLLKSGDSENNVSIGQGPIRCLIILLLFWSSVARFGPKSASTSLLVVLFFRNIVCRGCRSNANVLFVGFIDSEVEEALVLGFGELPILHGTVCRIFIRPSSPLTTDSPRISTCSCTLHLTPFGLILLLWTRKIRCKDHLGHFVPLTTFH